jgi:GNAT superfamily N-acetyltransferase
MRGDAGVVELGVGQIGALSCSILGMTGDEAAYLKKWAEAGHCVVGVFATGTCVGVGLLAVGFKSMFTKQFELAGHECFVSRVIIAPSMRGKGFMATLLQGSARIGAARGCTLMYADIASQNVASQRGAAKAGMRPLESGFYRIRFAYRDWIFPWGDLRGRFVKV